MQGDTGTLEKVALSISGSNPVGLSTLLHYVPGSSQYFQYAGLIIEDPEGGDFEISAPHFISFYTGTNQTPVRFANVTLDGTVLESLSYGPSASIFNTSIVVNLTAGAAITLAMRFITQEGPSPLSSTGYQYNEARSFSFSTPRNYYVRSVTVEEGNAGSKAFKVGIDASSASTAPFEIQLSLPSDSPLVFANNNSKSFTTTMPAGATHVDVPLLVASDINPETNKDYIISAQSSAGASAGVITVVDDDIPRLVLTNPTISTAEGTTGNFHLELAQKADYDIAVALAPVEPNWAKDISFASTFVIPAGQTGIDIPIQILTDQSFEHIEQQTFSITAKGARITDSIVYLSASGITNTTAALSVKATLNIQDVPVAKDFSEGLQTIQTILDRRSDFFSLLASTAGADAKFYSDGLKKTLGNGYVTIALTVGAALTDLGADLAAAGSNAEARAQAFIRADVNVYSSLIKTMAVVAGTDALTGFGAGVVAGALGVSAPIAIPTAAVIVVGLGLGFAYDKLLDNYVRESLYRDISYYISNVVHLSHGVDQDYYLRTNPDVALSNSDAFQHYDLYGWHEGRDPNALFSTSGYLATNADVRATGINPLNHYDLYGRHEGRDPGLAFDTQGYLALNPDVKASGINPLLHYLQYGKAEGRVAPEAVIRPTDTGFDIGFYLMANRDVAAAGINPIQHYQTFGWREGRDPNNYFDTSSYLALNPDVAAAGIDPLAHYTSLGWKEHRHTGSFDGDAYLQKYADIAAENINPLTHYLLYGINEGRLASIDVLL